MKKSNLLFVTVVAIFIAASVWPVRTATAASLTLAKEGKTNYVIVLSDAPTEVEQTAAKELKLHLDTVTGADFPVKTESQVPSETPQILVGLTTRSKTLLPDLAPENLPYDGGVRRSVGKDIILIGHPQRGTLYAVNTFLEDAVGVRWWTSTESFFPNKPTLEVPSQNYQYAPKLIYREAYYKDAFDGLFASRMKCNGNMVRIGPEYGGHYRFFHFVHSFFPLLPPDKYFKDHPEWYSEIGGQRKHERAQLCLSNDAMCAELTKNAIAGLKQRPECKFISISQNDWHGYCECEKCTKIAEEEESQAGPLLRFVNSVAAEIEKEFPDVWVETLAYQYTRKPPKTVRPRKNVVIRLCSIECSFIQPLAVGTQNEPFRSDIEGWSKIAERLFIWDYTVNFSAYMLPHPNYRVLGPNLKFFVDHHTIGMFEQGDSFCTAGDFVRMKNWVLSQLMWDPTQDAEKLYNEFLEGYYGKSAPMVRRYMNLLMDEAEKSDVFFRCYRKSTSDWLSSDNVFVAKRLMDEAIAAADNSTIRARLSRDSIPIDLVILNSFHLLKEHSEQSGDSLALFRDPMAFVDDFFARCKRFGVSAYREGNKQADFDQFEQGKRKEIMEGMK